MKIAIWDNLSKTEKVKILERNLSNLDESLTNTVKDIIHNVKNRGDIALHEYALQFDKIALDNICVSEDELLQSNQLPDSDKVSIKTAIKNISLYHERCLPKAFEYEQNKITLGKMYRPIDKVGLYIPGGTAPLVSTVMMLAIPALIAGCKTRVLATPARPDGTINPGILFAAKECGIQTIYKMGGAQAIAAMAYGTNSIEKVYKIFGPGNKYVTEAKIQVASSMNGAAIDMPAGPSEVLVIAEENANAKYIASDLLAQAEHDVVAHVVFVTTSEKLVNAVKLELQRQTAYLSRRDIIEKSLANSVIILANSIKQCFEISNIYAPEHLILHIKDAKEYLSLVDNAGSVFIGEFSPEAVGDYASGPNHVLPTYGYANMYSGLDVNHFMKSISYQELSREGLDHIGETVMTLANLEGLDAHKNAVAVRLA